MLKKEHTVSKSKKLAQVITDLGFSYSFACKALKNKDVKVNSKICKENIKVEVGDVVTFYFKEEGKKYDIIYESANVILINKYAAIEVDQGLEEQLNAYAVHRLDRNTEGLVVFAKNMQAKQKLEMAFKKHLIEKYYICEVVGRFETDKIYKAYLLKDSENSIVKVFDKKVQNGVEISTGVKTIKANLQSSLLKIKLISGKTHQIRAHLAHLGYPIIGDGKYGKNEDNKKFKACKQRLFAYSLKFGDVGIEEINNKEFKLKPYWLNVDVTL